MTVAELRQLLDSVPGDMTVLVYDEGYLAEAESASIEKAAAVPGEGNVLRWIFEHSGHPPDVVKAATSYFIIC